MKNFISFCCMLVALAFNVQAQRCELNITPGQLKSMLLGYNGDPSELILSGTLNSTDLKYINEGSGKISSVTTLDLSSITLSYDDGEYAVTGDYSDIHHDNNHRSHHFILSAQNRTDTVYSVSGVGIVYTDYFDYSNNLAGFLANNKTLRKVVLPDGIVSFGEAMFYNSDVEEITFPGRTENIPGWAFGQSKIKKVNAPGVRSLGSGSFSESAINDFDFSNIYEIGPYAFYSSSLTGTVILNGMEAIPVGCFYGTGVREVVINSGTKEIGMAAFQNCMLTRVVLPEGLESIGSHAFYSTTANPEMTIPSTVTAIGSRAFPPVWARNLPDTDGIVYIGNSAYGLGRNYPGKLAFRPGTTVICGGFDSNCTEGSDITVITIPSSVEIIGETESPYSCQVFHGDSLEEVMFESGSALKIIGKEAFYQCYALASANLPDGLVYIGARAFQGLSKLKLSLPETLEYVGDYAITEVTLLNFPSNLVHIGTEAFGSCKLPSSITLGNTLAELKFDAFRNATGVYHVIVDISDKFKQEDCNTGLHSVEMVTVKATATYLPGQLFIDNPNLSICVFEEPESHSPALFIGDEVFYMCPSLSLDRLPVRVAGIGASSFEGCTFTNQPVLNTGELHSIGKKAFYGTTGFETVELAQNLEKCQGYAFGNINTLIEVKLEASKLSTETDQGSWMGASPQPLFAGSSLRSVWIAANVTDIPGSLFSECDELSQVTFESREAKAVPLEIGEGAFRNCALDSIVLPDVPTMIGVSAFSYNDLSYVQLGKGTKELGEGAFSNCSKLTSITIPATVEGIGRNAFYATALDDLVFESREQLMTPLNIDIRAFARTYLGSLVLPDVPTAIGESAFEGCPIFELQLGIGTYSIGQRAFRDTYLTYINIPATVNHIGYTAFFRNGASPDVYFYSEVPPTVEELFVASGSKVYVPERAFEAYSLVMSYDLYTYGTDILSFYEEEVKLDPESSVDLYVLFNPQSLNRMPLRFEASGPDIVAMERNGSDSVMITALNDGASFITASLYYNSDIYTQCRVLVGNYEDNGVGNIFSDSDKIVSVYSIGGVLIRKDCTVREVETLPRGIYILVSADGSRKIVL